MMLGYQTTIILAIASFTAATRVTIDTASILFKVDPTYISYCVDAYLLGTEPRWMNFDFRSPKLRFLMKELSPAILRFGGSPADWTIFSNLDEWNVLNNTGLQPSLTVFTKSDLDSMAELTRETGNRFLFDLNLQLRYGTQWDPSNAEKMFDYIVSKGYGDTIDFELGNEPAAYNKVGQVRAEPHQVGRDFVSLWRLLASYPGLQHSGLVGPDEVDVGDALGANIIRQVTEQCGDNMRAITIHHYYFRGDLAKASDYLDSKWFAGLNDTIRQARVIIQNTSHPHVPLWIGETADAWHSGTQNVSDRFISGFLWLEKLGLAATLGVSVVMRQTLYGHNYGLLDDALNPNPDYWLSWIHKQLVGQVVLKVSTSTTPGRLPTTRVYVHCTNTYRTNYPPGSITLFALNVNLNETDVLHLDPVWTNQEADIYQLTPPPGDRDYLLSKFLAVNGVTLHLLGDKMPVMKPRTVTISGAIPLQPVSMLFAVFPHAKADTCI